MSAEEAWEPERAHTMVAGGWMRPAGLWLLIVSGWLPVAQARGSGAGPPPVDYMIVVTGSELLAGAYADGHTFFLTRTLRPLGLRCVGSMCVPDTSAAIKQALQFSLSKARLVIVTGGLGPTDNDITRQTLADVTGIGLREDPEVLLALARRFRVEPDGLRANLRRQAQVPVKGGYLKNAHGTAVGLIFELPEAVVVALPGPPSELQPMVRNELVPYLGRRFGTHSTGCSITLRFVGIGQSRISQVLSQQVALGPDVELSSQFEAGRVDFTFALPDDTVANRARLQRIKQRLLEHLADYVYADDATTLEQHVVGLLAARCETLTLAEVGSGGSLAMALGTVPKADRVLVGGYVAPTEPKLAQLLRVPEERWAKAQSAADRAKTLAGAAAAAAGSQWAVAVGQLQYDPDGRRSAHVQVAFRGPGGQVDSQSVRLRAGGRAGRQRLTTWLLDQLRRRLHH